MKITIPEEIANRISEILDATPGLVAQLAANYSQDAFIKKAFDRNPWPLNRDPQRQGKELIRSGQLRKSMTIETEGNRAVISYGNDQVNYAQVHNEGFDGEVVVPAHIRHTKRGEQAVREHTRHMRIPQRQFLGQAEELEAIIREEIEAMVDQLFNK